MPNGLSLPPTVSFPLLASDGSAAAPSYSFASQTNTGMYYASSTIRLAVGGVDILTTAAAGLTTTVPVLFSPDNGVDIGATGATRPRSVYLGTSLLIQSNTGLIGFGTTKDLQLSRLAAASLQQGLANSATPIAQTFTLGESSRGGTDTDVAGSSGTIRPGNGTGAATGSSLIFATPTAGASSTTAQTYNTRLTINQTSVLAAVAYDTSSVYKVNATQVVGARATGWGSVSGTLNKTSINGSVGETAAVLTQRVAAIYDAMLTHGLIGA